MKYTVIDNGVEYDLYTAPLPLNPDGVTGVFTKPFFLLNLAVGGNFTDAITDAELTAPVPAKMYIDYVRVSEWNGYGTEAPSEGSEVIAWETTAADSWFGGGLVALFGKNMSNYVENGSLKVDIKIPADVSFRIGVTDNYTNESWLEFPANTITYGLTRDGKWGTSEIAISKLSSFLRHELHVCDIKSRRFVSNIYFSDY